MQSYGKSIELIIMGVWFKANRSKDLIQTSYTYYPTALLFAQEVYLW